MRAYYERNRWKICNYFINIYMPKAIDTIHKKIPEKVSVLYQKYPYETYGDLPIKRRLRICKIKENQMEYQECYDAAMEAYLYSIHRCAFCDYEYVAYYIKKMISVAIICGINIAQESKHLCKVNGFKQVNLDSCDRNDRW